MTAIGDIPSGVTNSVRGETRTLVDYVETIGTPADAPATDVDDENSAFSLMKGILSVLGVPAGAGTATVNTSANLYTNPTLTLGDQSDAAATVASASSSALALLKGIFAQLRL